ncbi:acyl-protein thioesterase 1-like [Hydractinia symbiolongicarpus]|uniref:acyl-protein thioesterase 1-like n=1 Tax=Hydractinia symbiolongicarpus TaxID=13093 RepID=UPI0025514CCC|nr:acyl-protein thioesterase 1-like [Hydractinia symbiolongicarpus]
MACPTILPKAKHTATVIFLHGLGDTGHGWLAGFEDIALPYVKYMCPNAPVQAVTLNAGMKMPSWFDIKSLSFDGKEDDEGLEKSANSIKKLIQEEGKIGIPANRIVIGGFSQGGSTALHTFITSEEKLAGCIGLSSFMSQHQKFPANRKEANKDTPILIGHGDVDPIVKYQFGMMTSTVLKQYYTDVTFNTYKNMVHSSSPKEMNDVAEFLEKVLPNSS